MIRKQNFYKNKYFVNDSKNHQSDYDKNRNYKSKYYVNDSSNHIAKQNENSLNSYQSDIFYKKYCKYKTKYLLLKSIKGGATNTQPPTSAEEIGVLLIERAVSIKEDGLRAEEKDDRKAEEKDDRKAEEKDDRKAEEKDDRKAEEKDDRRAEEVQSKNEQLKDNSKEDEIRRIDTLIDNAEQEALVTKKSFFDLLAEKLLASLPKETARSKRMMNRSKIIGERLRKKNVDVSELRK
jgi:hypothetical protein